MPNKFVYGVENTCIPYHQAFQSGKEDDSGGKNAVQLANLYRCQIGR